MNDYLNPQPPVVAVSPEAVLAQVLAATAEAYEASYQHKVMLERREVADLDGDLASIQEQVEAVVTRSVKAHSDLAALTDEHLLGYCQQAEGAEDVLQAVRLIVAQIVPMVNAADQALEKAVFEGLMREAFNNQDQPDNDNEQEAEDG